MTRDVVNQVRELLERQIGIFDIAHKMSISIDTVKLASDIIKKVTK